MRLHLPTSKLAIPPCPRTTNIVTRNTHVAAKKHLHTSPTTMTTIMPSSAAASPLAHTGWAVGATEVHKTFRFKGFKKCWVGCVTCDNFWVFSFCFFIVSLFLTSPGPLSFSYLTGGRGMGMGDK